MQHKDFGWGLKVRLTASMSPTYLSESRKLWRGITTFPIVACQDREETTKDGAGPTVGHRAGRVAGKAANEAAKTGPDSLLAGIP